MATIERRAILEVRAAGRRLEGIAAPFDQVAHIAGFDEIIRRGAFAESISSDRDILALVDHDATKLLGRTRNRSLRLEETRAGLEFEIDLPNTGLANDVLELARAGSLGGASFGFTVKPAGERWIKNVRELRQVQLHEISAVSAWVAYPETSVFARCRPPIRLCMAQRYLETC